MQPPCDSVVGRRVLTALAVAVCVGGTSGCPRPSESSRRQATSKAKPSRVRVIVVDDGPFAAVLERQWKARIDNELQLQQMTIEEVESARQLPADMIFYPSACLGVLVERKLITAPSDEIWDDDAVCRPRHIRIAAACGRAVGRTTLCVLVRLSAARSDVPRGYFSGVGSACPANVDGVRRAAASTGPRSTGLVRAAG